MPTTTSLGSLSRFLGESPEDQIRAFINGGDAPWRAWVYESGAFDTMVDALRDALDAGLPDGAWLAGDEVHVDALQPQDEQDALYEEARAWLGDIDDAVLAAIVEEHAPDGAHLQDALH